MNTLKKLSVLGALVGLCGIAAARQSLPEGTEVNLRFDDALSSGSAKAGDRVHLHVSRDVIVKGRMEIPAGTLVKGTIAAVSKHDRFGKHARLRIALDPVLVRGVEVSLEPRGKGKELAGSRTDEAAAASGGGLLALGPLGLAAGYFVVGHSVQVMPGDRLRTVVSHTVYWR